MGWTFRDDEAVKENVNHLYFVYEFEMAFLILFCVEVAPCSLHFDMNLEIY